VESSMSKAGLDNRQDLPKGLRSLKALARRSGCRS